MMRGRGGLYNLVRLSATDKRVNDTTSVDRGKHGADTFGHSIAPCLGPSLGLLGRRLLRAHDIPGMYSMIWPKVGVADLVVLEMLFDMAAAA
jgi:hypothetical protein